MARPTVQHNGFLIPNAQDVSNTVLAEPDKIDFNTIADARWGVVSGCALGEQGPLALTVGSGVAVVAGKLVPVRGGTVTLTQPTTGSRFINVVVDDGGVVRSVDGPATTDPVFPDVASVHTLLATVHATSDAASLQDFVIDKRKFLTPALFANVGPTNDLIVNYNSPAPVNGDPSQWFRVNGQGDITWAGDTTLKRLDEFALTLDKRLDAQSLSALSHIISHTGNIQAYEGTVTARNLRNAPHAFKPSSPGLGDLWQDTTNGTVNVGTRDPLTGDLEWQPLATADTALPYGTIIDSVETKVIMEDKGWLALDGRVVSEDEYPNLFKLVAMEPWISGGTEPHRQMTLPDMERRFRITDSDDTARTGGSNYKYLTLQQMPKHDHNVKVDTHGDIQPTAQLSGMSGAHGHPINGDGEHDHDVYDKGHTHDKFFVAVADWGGSMLDGLINDRSHTWKVDIYQTTATGYANIVAKPAKIGGLSIPTASGYHNHTVQVSKITGLTHTVRESQVGEGSAIDVTPAYFTVRTYIRT